MISHEQGIDAAAPASAASAAWLWTASKTEQDTCMHRGARRMVYRRDYCARRMAISNCTRPAGTTENQFTDATVRATSTISFRAVAKAVGVRSTMASILSQST